MERLLRAFGFSLIRHGAGHDIWRRPSGGRSVTVPRSRASGEMPGTLVEEILEEAGIPVADALALWGIRPRQP